ncbi:MAG: hypothetical protein O3A37_04655 [Planctomycetota bacterium]|nr:hypothetical protein [Planctomycetota bacterium]
MARQSTDTVAAESPEAQAALEMIRARACVTLGRYRREMRRG